MQLTCTSSEPDLAIRELDAARQHLASARSFHASRFAPEASALAERAFSEAELEVRRRKASLLAFTEGSRWRLKVQQASELARIAAWVAETDRDRARREAQTWAWEAESVLDGQFGERQPGLPAAVRSKVAQARLMLVEAESLLEEQDFSSAMDRARRAHELAGGAQMEVEELLARFEDPVNLRHWRDWVAQAMGHSRTTGLRALVVDKFGHRAILYDRGKIQRISNVELGHKSLHRKVMAGDGATPEGVYRVLRKKGSGHTSYHKALLLDYPNETDRQRFLQAKREGRIPVHARPGGLIEVHGDGGRGNDWTDGCVAVSNREMDYLFERLSVGSSVAIVGRYDGAGGR